MSDFNIIPDLFSNRFPSQCTPLKNTSSLSNFKYKTDTGLTSFDIYEDNILLIRKNLNVHKAHDWDNSSIATIKICGKSINLQFKLIFKSILHD